MPTQPTAGRSLVARRAVIDLVRTATLGSYGVTGLAGRPIRRWFDRVGLLRSGIRVDLGPPLEIELDLTVAHGVPVAEVARQVDSAVRHAVRSATGREVGSVAVHVGSLRFQTGGPPSGERDGA